MPWRGDEGQTGDVPSITEIRAQLSARLAPRPAEPEGAAASVLGAGASDATLVAAGRAYLGALADTGCAVPTWPVEHGGLGAELTFAAAIGRELAGFTVPDLYPFLIGLSIAGPTILQ